MSTNDLNLSDIASLSQALERIPNGRDAAELANKLGLWTAASHRSPGAREAFPRNLSSLSPPQLSDLSAKVISDAGRLVELVGLLRGLNDQVKMRSKATRSRARAALRRARAAERDAEGRAPKPYTVAELNDLADEDESVMAIESQLEVLAVVLASAEAAKEAMFLYRDTISREITFRCAQMDARIY